MHIEPYKNKSFLKMYLDVISYCNYAGISKILHRHINGLSGIHASYFMYTIGFEMPELSAARAVKRFFLH